MFKKKINPVFKSEYLIIIFFLLFVYVYIQTAWVSQDAYISYRVIDNFINGFGLTWNITERVQGYTHPLWLLIHIPFYYITSEIFLTSILISGVFSLLTVGVIVERVSKNYLTASLTIITMIFSRAFMDYTTSGLENPLSHFLLVIFYMTYASKKIHITRLTILASFLIFTRLDNIVILLPFLIKYYWQHKNQIKLKNIIIGTSPILVWEIFSLIYYGSFLPNTAYAKLNTVFSHTQIFKQGFYYLKHTFYTDPVTILIIFIAILLSIRKQLVVSTALMLHLLYVVYIGGDFMEGRFLTVPFILSVCYLASSIHINKVRSFILYLVIIIIVGFNSSQPPILNNRHYDYHEFDHGIADERGFYYQRQGLLSSSIELGQPTYKYRKELLLLTPHQVIVEKNIGSMGFHAGPTVHIVDELALTDAFLSRLKPRPGQDYRPGHLVRNLPEGYLKTLQTGQNQIRNPKLAKFYDYLSLIISGPLFHPQRIKAIWLLNVGQLDYLFTIKDN